MPATTPVLVQELTDQVMAETREPETPEVEGHSVSAKDFVSSADLDALAELLVPRLMLINDSAEPDDPPPN